MDHVSDAREQIQRRLAVIDQQLTNIRGHIARMDPALADGIGMYGEAQRLADERQDLERDLVALAVPCADDLPNEAELRARTAAAFDDLAAVMDGGTIEERREMLGLYVQTIEADPDSQGVRIGLYPPLFSRKIARNFWSGCKRRRPHG